MRVDQSLVPVAVAAAGWAASAVAAARLRHRLHTDALTGLANRQGLARRFAGLHPDVSAGVLLIDLDEFKRVNDTYGHDEGNRVLRCVAARLHATAGAGELPARLHGDEFAVLLLSTDPTHAAARVQVYRDAIAQVLVTDRARHQVAGSVGAAVLPAGVGLGALLSAADSAMYEAKPGRDTRRPVRLHGVVAA